MGGSRLISVRDGSDLPADETSERAAEVGGSDMNGAKDPPDGGNVEDVFRPWAHGRDFLPLLLERFATDSEGI